ncbi:hypothetical protein D9619_008400 [Psilocybe cf. subviscida]|uniref:Fungal N-terminal domain-containing protein n=1 Tax=Psilocybe cf. subviscida TaxID=2480587 RepID=A0A8H5BA67_9AGAR|nr:hypothetical protein D9619_008400 [Psilocybe cf. subviscida]
MNPFSATLAVISLATAVKDLVELGRKIHESFAKVSNNLRSARHVAADIKEMVQEIKVFCEDHKDALDDMNDFRVALQGLLAKFRGFEATILPLLPEPGGRRRRRLFRSWDAWRNNSKIEESILDLQCDIVKVMRTYMMKSAMRTELKLEAIHRSTSGGLVNVHKGMEQGFEVIRRDVSALRVTTAAATMKHRSYESTWETRDDFNRNVVMFAKSTPSTSAPMLRRPDLITEELMTTAYIKLQINNIATALEKMSKLPAPPPNGNSVTPNSVGIFEMSTMLEQASMNITRLRHHVVRQVIGIRDLLDSNCMQAVSMHEGASALNKLAVGLRALGMGQECMLVANWATRLARILVDASDGRHPDLGADLALYLLNQSIQYHCSDDKALSLQTIGEAYTITHNLRLANSLRGVDADIQILYSSVLLQFAELVDIQWSIQMSIEAVQVLEDSLNVQAFTQSEPLDKTKIKMVVQPTSSFLECLFSSAPTTTAITKYACALQRLGAFLFTDDCPESALGLTLLAIAVRRKMVSIHGPEHSAPLAGALSSLVQGGIASYIPLEELVNVADECTRLLRELTEKNPQYYARELVSVLWRKANTLASLDREAEAIATLEEAACLAEQIAQDSKLYATALGHLSEGFRRLERHDDAI